jgi:hypothetical protein
MGTGSPPLTPQQPTTGPDPTFQSAAQQAIVAFALQGVAPPTPLYVTPADRLLLRLFTNNAGGDTITFLWRFLQASPEVGGQPDNPPAATVRQPTPVVTQIVKSQGHALTVAATGSTNVTLALAEGYLLSIGAIATLALSRGVTFASASIVRTGPSGASTTIPLFADYVTPIFGAGWPNGRYSDPLSGPGFITSIQVTNPGAGSDWTFTVGGHMRIQSFTAQLVASAAVANRNVEIIVDDGANVVWRHSAPVSITAGTTFQVSGTGTNAPTGIIATDISVVLPPGLLLAAGMRVRTATAGIQAGDVWSNIFFLIERWLDF